MVPKVWTALAARLVTPVAPSEVSALTRKIPWSMKKPVP